jgi:hypothetical protein
MIIQEQLLRTESMERDSDELMRKATELILRARQHFRLLGEQNLHHRKWPHDRSKAPDSVASPSTPSAMSAESSADPCRCLQSQ